MSKALYVSFFHFCLYCLTDLAHQVRKMACRFFFRAEELLQPQWSRTLKHRVSEEWIPSRGRQEGINRCRLLWITLDLWFPLKGCLEITDNLSWMGICWCWGITYTFKVTVLKKGKMQLKKGFFFFLNTIFPTGSKPEKGANSRAKEFMGWEKLLPQVSVSKYL